MNSKKPLKLKKLYSFRTDEHKQKLSQRKNAPKTASQVYKDLCQKNNFLVNSTLLHNLQSKDLSLSLDQIQLNDINALQQILNRFNFISFSIFGAQFPKPLHPRPSSIFPLLSSALNNSLKFLTLQHLQLSTTLISQLSQVLRQSKQLTSLALIQCNLTNDTLETVFPNFKLPGKLNILDLSQNNLATAKHPHSLIKLLQNHIKQSNNQVEQQLELIIEKCWLSDDFLLQLCDLLSENTIIRRIGIRGNKISKFGIKEAVNLLEKNETLLSLDLRDNPGFQGSQSKKILELLMRNVKIMKLEKMSKVSPKQKGEEKLKEEFEQYLEQILFKDEMPAKSLFEFNYYIYQMKWNTLFIIFQWEIQLKK